MSAGTVWFIMTLAALSSVWAAYKLGHSHGWDAGRDFGRLIERSKAAQKKQKEGGK